jgi:hypothetical protein
MRMWLGAVALAVAASTAPALAHHPFAAEYDWKKPVTITGTVTKFDWENPHSMMLLKGRDDNGAEADWTVELGSPGRLTALGWKSHELKAGERVTVDGWLAKDGRKRLSAKSVTSGRRELAAASSFFEASPSTSPTVKKVSTAPATPRR